MISVSDVLLLHGVWLFILGCCFENFWEQNLERFWESSKRLAHGSLVCLWWQLEDGGVQLTFATIAVRDPKKMGQDPHR